MSSIIQTLFCNQIVKSFSTSSYLNEVETLVNKMLTEIRLIFFSDTIDLRIKFLFPLLLAEDCVSKTKNMYTLNQLLLLFTPNGLNISSERYNSEIQVKFYLTELVKYHLAERMGKHLAITPNLTMIQFLSAVFLPLQLTVDKLFVISKQNSLESMVATIENLFSSTQADLFQSSLSCFSSETSCHNDSLAFMISQRLELPLSDIQPLISSVSVNSKVLLLPYIKLLPKVRAALLKVGLSETYNKLGDLLMTVKLNRVALLYGSLVSDDDKRKSAINLFLKTLKVKTEILYWTNFLELSFPNANTLVKRLGDSKHPSSKILLDYVGIKKPKLVSLF